MLVWNKIVEIDTATELKTYFAQVMSIIQKKRIQKVFSPSALADMTDEEIYFQFEDGICLVIRTGAPSYVQLELQSTTKIWYHDELCGEKPFFNDLYGKYIKKVKVKTFSEGHFTDPCERNYRPDGGDYFSQITLEFNGQTKLILSPYIDGWMNFFIQKRMV